MNLIVYNSFQNYDNYLYYEILDIVAQKVLIYDYAMAARKEEDENESPDVSNFNSPDEPKSPETIDENLFSHFES